MDGGLISRYLGRVGYSPTVEAMRAFTETRTAQTRDELWFLEHPPVFTQGQAGKAEHLIAPGDIPVVATSRGGQVTYHGPGQLVMYPLIDLHRRGIGVRHLVTALEQAMIATAAHWKVAAFARAEAPGIYVERDFGSGPEVRKLGSIGLRVSRGCSYHGVSLNVAMDLEPFSRINPCGYPGLRMTQLCELGGTGDLGAVATELRSNLLAILAG